MQITDLDGKSYWNDEQIQRTRRLLADTQPAELESNQLAGNDNDIHPANFGEIVLPEAVSSIQARMAKLMEEIRNEEALNVDLGSEEESHQTDKTAEAAIARKKDLVAALASIAQSMEHKAERLALPLLPRGRLPVMRLAEVAAF